MDTPSTTKNILLVEDEIFIALAGKATLEPNGYHVLTASSGEQAVEIATANESVDLILMDIDLGSGMSGTDAARRILEQRDVPLAFLSSHTDPRIVESTEGITSYGYIVKTSGATVLLASIRMAFRLHEEKVARLESEERTRLMSEMLDAAPGSIMIHDFDGHILYANQRACDAHGYTREQYMKLNLREMDSEESAAKIGERMQLLQATGSANFDVTHRRADGALVPFQVYAKIVQWGSIPAIISVSTEIT